MYALMQAGENPSALAKQFVTNLSQSRYLRAELIWEKAALFVNDCFDAINLELRLNAEDLQNNLSYFTWPKDVIQRYIFEFDSAKFHKMEKYLNKISIEIKSLATEFKTLPIEERVHVRSPMVGFIRVLLAWLSTSDKLKEQENSIFVEPIARIDCQLLLGLHLVCDEFQHAYPILKTICGRLFLSASLGIRSPRAYAKVSTELLTLLQNNFHFYLPQLNTNENFYEIALYVKKAQGIRNKVFKSFVILLDKHCLNRDQQNNAHIRDQQYQRSLDVSNFLKRSNMLQAYHFFLKKERNEWTLKYLLEFLLRLQSKLVDLNCFDNRFMWSTLALLCGEYKIVSDIVANFFTIIMKQRCEYHELCEIVVEFYFLNFDQGHTLSLQKYIGYMWKYLGVRENVNHFLNMITVSEQKRRIQAARFLNEFIRYLCKNYATNRFQISQLVRGIVRKLESINCLFTESLLASVAEVIEEAYVIYNEEELKELLKLFEMTAEKKFVALEDLQYPLRKHYFKIFINIAENDDRIQATLRLTKIECIQLVTDAENRFKLLTESELTKISCALQNLNLVTQMQLCEREEAAILCDLLQRNLFAEIESQELSVFHELAKEHKMLLDVYALKLYVGCLLIMLDSPENRVIAMERTLVLEEYLTNWLANTDQLALQPIARIKTYFNCMLRLSIDFSSDFLKFTTSTYELLVRTLEWILFQMKKSSQDYKEFAELDPSIELYYQITMLFYLIKLHKSETVKITTDIWHICFHFSLPEGEPFDEHLRELMTVLAERHYEIFRHILPVIIFNLFTPQSNLNTQTIKSSFKAHKDFIFELNHPRKCLLCCFIVFEVMVKLRTALELGTRTGPDRMAPLKYLHIILSDFEIHQIVKEDLKMQARSLMNFAHGAEETSLIQEFLNYVENARS